MRLGPNFSSMHRFAKAVLIILGIDNSERPVFSSLFAPRMIQLVLLAITLTAIASPRASARTIFVQPGTSPTENTFASLLEAVEAVPKIRSGLAAGEEITIELPPGIHRLSEPILLNAMNSGLPSSPLTIRGASDGSSQLLGSALISSRPAIPSDAPDVRIPAEVRFAALPSQPFEFHKSRRSTYTKISSSGLEVFQGDRRLTFARWPRQGFSEDISVRFSGQFPEVRLSPEQTKQLSNEKAMWISGYWARDWAYESVPVKSFDPASQTFQVDRLQTPLQARSHFRFFVENILGGLSSPGQMVLNSPNHLLFIPYEGQESEVSVSVSKHIFVLQNARNVHIERLQLGQTLGEAIRIVNSSDIEVRECSIKGTGTWGAVVSASARVSFDRCLISETAEGGISLDGGNRRTLARSDNFVRNSVVAYFGLENPAYRPGIQLQGVGNTVVGSLIAHGPHSGITVSGNDNTIESNELTDLLTQTDDAGAIYMGRDWSMRGNLITGNFFHDILPNSKRTAVGVYLDDQFSGATIDRNVFYKVNLPILLGGGRDNKISRNLFLAPTKAAILADNRGMTWQRPMVSSELEKKLVAMPFQSETWRVRYPSLAAISAEQKGEPGGNEIRSNAVAGGALKRFLGEATERLVNLSDNQDELSLPDETGAKSAREAVSTFLSLHPDVSRALALPALPKRME
ncbi:right-handed parallel beta-helix repeat-containing protein [Bradyrhizobium yuanmingense]|uniref:right-handed parallel beta-helix repeat-containing protein n=1 Tax=Bradyrhizobium yuanmingense TaxID=108015 RepID=UPI0012FA4902|nr:right-handed parallel beta-helix repeat-containing protein [Bradyrhizobium yuanmingense]